MVASDVPLDSLTLSDRAESLFLTATARISLSLPSAYSRLPNARKLAALARPQVWVSHPGPCLLHASFSIGGTPLSSAFALKHLAPIIVDSELWSRLGLRLGLHSCPLPATSSIVRFVRHQDAPTTTTLPPPGESNMPEFHFLYCSFDLLSGHHLLDFGLPTKRQTHREPNTCFDPDAEYSRGLRELVGWGLDDSVQAAEDSGNAVIWTPSTGPVPSSQPDRGKKRRKQGATPAAETILFSIENVMAHEEMPNLVEAALYTLLTRKRPVTVKMHSPIGSNSLLKLAPAVFSAKYQEAITARIGLLHVVSSALSVARDAQSPSLQRKFSKLTASVHSSRSTKTPSLDESVLQDIESRLWSLVKLVVPVQLPCLKIRRTTAAVIPLSAISMDATNGKDQPNPLPPKAFNLSCPEEDACTIVDKCFDRGVQDTAYWDELVDWIEDPVVSSEQVAAVAPEYSQTLYDPFFDAVHEYGLQHEAPPLDWRGADTLMFDRACDSFGFEPLGVIPESASPFSPQIFWDEAFFM